MPHPTALGASHPTVATARDALRQFAELERPNAFTSDAQFQRLLGRYLGAAYAQHAPQLERFGAIAMGPLDDAARENNQNENLPRLGRWSPYGERLEGVTHHPSYDVCGRHIYQDGEVIAAYAERPGNVLALARAYIAGHAGEAGHNCPVACTAGVVKALRKKGSAELQARWLPGLLTANYAERLDGAQFITELQGGSDVGQNAVRAEPDGTAMGTTRWRLYGEKWFCSNAAAALQLVTARVDDAKTGTSGLGLFLVPRHLDEAGGQVNAYSLRRLKDKIGTRSMPSGEIDYNGAVGYAVGPVTEGFKTLMTEVIQTSRIYNTVAVTGAARRARLVAHAYAKTRAAFGTPIIGFPLVQGMLAEIRGIGQASLAAGLHLAHLLDEDERRGLAAPERAYLRVAANLVKMRTAQLAHRAILLAIETLGGNGTIETFSVLPRLMRDNVVCENWEGTHNTLIAQTVRDFGPIGLAPGFFATLGGLFVEAARDPAVAQALAPAREAVTAAHDALASLASERDPGRAAFFLRPHAERLGDAVLAATFGVDIATERDAARRTADTDTLTQFVDLYLRGTKAPWDVAMADRVARIAQLEG